MATADLLRLLAGPDRRSIGRSAFAVRLVLREPTLLPTLVRGLTVADPLVRMRSADALEKVARHRPAPVGRYRAHLLRLAETARQPEVQWHLAQILPRLSLTPAQRARARRAFRGYLRSSSSIVRTMALDALARVAPATPGGRRRLRRLLLAAARSGTPAMRARARRLLESPGES